MRSAFRSVSTLRLFMLAMLALVLTLRVGPFCEAARAAATPTVQMADCHEHGAPAPAHTPAPAENGASDMTCMTPCAIITPEIAQAQPAAQPAALPRQTPNRALRGIVTLPDTPPPRWA